MELSQTTIPEFKNGVKYCECIDPDFNQYMEVDLNDRLVSFNICNKCEGRQPLCTSI